MIRASAPANPNSLFCSDFFRSLLARYCIEALIDMPGAFSACLRENMFIELNGYS
jgi:hypothetical protein